TTMMIHRAWGAVIGNYHDFTAAAPVFDGFDRNMAAIYAGRTGKSEADIIAMLDGPSRRSDGTYLTAAEAIDQKFADGTFDGAADAAPSARADVPEPILARRRWEAKLAHAGLTRKQRDEIFSLGQRDATRNATRDAGVDLADIRRFMENLKS
ncbi:ATP-dependent Clp protease proteolytic subunit, partial [Ancylobacter vacuolatus]